MNITSSTMSLEALARVLAARTAGGAQNGTNHSLPQSERTTTDSLQFLREGFQMMPGALATRRNAEVSFRCPHLVASPDLVKTLGRISTLLTSPELDALISADLVTLVGSKPHAEQSIGLSADDQEASNALLAKLGEADILFKISLVLTPQQVAAFYDPVRAKLEAMKSQGPPDSGYKTVWEEVVGFMPSGAVTFALVRKEQNAVKTVCDLIKDGPEALRKIHATQKTNNLLHCSDSVESVKREVKLLSEFIDQFVKRL